MLWKASEPRMITKVVSWRASSLQWCFQIVIPVNPLRPRQNGRPFADDTFKRIFLNENIRISTKNSLKFVPKGLINNIPALVLIMAWRRPGDKPLSEPMLVRSLTQYFSKRSIYKCYCGSDPNGRIWSDLRLIFSDEQYIGHLFYRSVGTAIAPRLYTSFLPI